MLFVLLIPVIQHKKMTFTQKLVKLRKKLDHDDAKYIIIREFNELTADYFAARLAQAKLATKDDTADFVKEKSFDNIIKI